MDPKMSPSVGKKHAFLVEVTDDTDPYDEPTSIVTEPDPPSATHDDAIHLPVVIDLKPPSNGEKNNQDGRGKVKDDPQITCYTCFVGPCPEIVNANFRHPEFMICYRDVNTRLENGMMRYYCCPLHLAAIKKDGEETFELRAVQTDTNIHAHRPPDFTHLGGAGNWHKYYNAQAHPNVNMSHRSYSNHHFSCRQVPPQMAFLHQCSYACPPQMMAYYLNSNYQGAAPQAAAPQAGYRQFAYQRAAYTPYIFPAHGSAMS